MAATFATISDYLKRTTGLLDCKNGPATVMFWVKQAAVGAGYHTSWIQLDAPGTYLDYFFVGSSLAADNVMEEQAIGGATTQTVHTTRTPGTWFHITVIRTGVSGTAMYINGLVDGTNSRNMSTGTFAEEYLGNDTFSEGGMTLAYARQWSAVLTASEIQIEMQSTTVQRTANLWADWPLTADANDTSGNGRNWTVNGSVTYVASPTFPTNGTQATAQALTGSDVLVPDFEDSFILWYSYLPTVSTEAVLSAFAIATLSDTITIRTFGPAQAAYPASGSIAGENVPIQIPLLTGTTVYLRLYASDNLTAPASLMTRKGPDNDAPIGTILINDDTADFPLALLDQTTGLPLKFVNPFPFGEMVAVLNDGTVYLEDAGANRITILDPDLTTIGSVAYPWGASLLGAMNSDREATIYASAFNSAVVYQMDTAGTVTGTFTVAVAVSLLCPNRDNTILYYVQAGNNRVIRRWDLVNDVALSDLAAGVVNHNAAKNLLVLADNTVLVGYQKSSATADYFVRRYSAAGATLNTYTLADTTEKINWIQLGITDDSTSFLIWSFPTLDVTSRFTYITVSDGSVLSETPIVPIYEVGVYQPSATLTPDSYFGHSKSCPIWVLAVGVEPTPPGVAEEFIIRRERWFPVINQENQRMTYSMLQVDLQAGNGLTTGQGSEPLLELDWSDDAGWTWSSIRFLPTGRIGQDNRRAIARVLGQSRQRVFRIAVSDPVQWVILDGYMSVKGGTS